MVEVSRSDTDERLLEVIEYWRTHDAERMERAERGRKLVKVSLMPWRRFDFA